MSDASCASCGAALRPGADVCDLCGTPVVGAEPDEADGPASGASRCARCGHAAPDGSAYCNRCGAALHDTLASPVPRTARPPSTVGRRAFAVAGIGLGVVVGLYAITLWSGREEAPSPPAAEQAVGPAQEIPAGAPPLPDTLQAAADRFAAEGTPSGWYESGRYYLTAAFEARQTDPTSSVRWARRAIQDFEQSLGLEENPDVRFALAEAAAFDPSDPMRPVQELQSVLTADPAHVGATLMMGERRLLIGRVDSARAAFERVIDLTPPGDPLRQRAQDALASMPSAVAGQE